MSDIRVEIYIDASPAKVWDYLEDIASHVNWMHDAAEIRFISDEKSGVGTKFECDTKVGPIKLTDIMTVTEWEPESTMGVEHVGLVQGTGQFQLIAEQVGTRFVWEESLKFPIWLGAKLGEIASRPILSYVWRKNLRNLKKDVEGLPS